MKIHPLQPISAIVLIAVLLYFRKKRKIDDGGAAATVKGAQPRPAIEKVERPAKPKEPPEVVYQNMRRRALETHFHSLNLAGEVKEDEPYGLVMEMGLQDSAVTLSCLANGDAGLYYQTGGGMIGGLAHENVRKASKEFVALGKTALPHMTRTAEYPLPEPGRVRFYALTPTGAFTAETDREELADPQNEFSRLFYSGQEVVGQMRQVQEQRGR